ncbi:hypothetical protein ILFOPFJJ_06817 [Ensifer psoraleae]|uniref:hypothetical protein n=1 Tax=Sinorhizobium psoraleae TaxID=520838 RepID=UPI0024AC2277|nr:hypothetical protein [Sinorhizobium psoraleae]
MLIAASLTAYVPLAAPGFLLVVFRELTEGILLGFALGTLLFLHRMAEAVEAKHTGPVAELHRPDRVDGNGRRPYADQMAPCRGGSNPLR